MPIGGRIRVLVVDDSMLFREVLCRGLGSDPGINVVASAADPFEARDKLLAYEPHVMTCDIEMPKMNGIEFIKRLLPQYPIPVIMVSNLNQVVFDAMNAGAVDFVAKPDVKSVKDVGQFVEEMIYKVKIAANAKIMTSSQGSFEASAPSVSYIGSKKLIAIGASTGGTEAIYSVLRGLPPKIPGVVVVQHMPPGFTRMYAERLNNQTQLNVKEAVTGDIVEEGKVLIAPGDMHLRVKKAGDKLSVECVKGERVNGHCPSVDVLFDSVAREVGRDSIGVILTGMGYDGAKGILAMRRRGAITIGQDEKSCVVYGMPKVAYELGGIEKQSPLDNISRLILKLLV